MDEQPESRIGAVRGSIFVDPELERFAQGTSYSEFRTLPEKELEHRFERLARTGELDFIFGPNDYLNELTRRDTVRQNQRLERLTWALVALTIVLAIATIALVWLERRATH
jgi:hypothetical protein